jgi:eukaryotic-like serine/threonine-protein kinase
VSVSDGLPDRLLAGRYRLTGMVGCGGMGTVWVASDEVLAREVAVKEVTLSPALSEPEREEACERTMREARAAARITHPNVVTVYDVVVDNGRPWIVMQLIASRTLADIIAVDGPLPPPQVAQIGIDVLAALEAAHSKGILHRDVKPSNVLLDERGQAFLTDFGIATIDGDTSLTATDALVGAPSYIAPERARALPSGPASDLWSLGATLYAAVEGHPPFDNDDALATLTSIVTDAPAPMTCAGELAPLLAGMLCKNPDARPDPLAVELALRQVVEGAPADRPTVVIKPRRRGHVPVLLGIMATTVVIAGLLMFRENAPVRSPQDQGVLPPAVTQTTSQVPTAAEVQPARKTGTTTRVNPTTTAPPVTTTTTPVTPSPTPPTTTVTTTTTTVTTSTSAEVTSTTPPSTS